MPKNDTQANEAYTPETDRKLSHKERIVAFLDKQEPGKYIILNDFFKSLYHLPNANEQPEWLNQGKMRKLRQDLRELQSEGKVQFANSNFERLGDNYHEGVEQFRRDHNITTLSILGRLA